ncbi:hypothetical protein [Sphingopyxis sp. MSC1_008]|uniref:hypothetical protein n=1 Tax=Sphingopyxis sp. MSC1_008 TaxID=2909265 RepID=UPI0020C16123|nr:hypothetical protein [Sphingopyxis sp. MSC1_008]
MPGTFSVRIWGTPGSAKLGVAAEFVESGREIWGWSFMAFSPIASPILPQAGQRLNAGPERIDNADRLTARSVNDKE